MGTIKTTNIETITGSGTLTLGQSGETVSIPTNTTLGASGTTITVPSGCTITNNGTQTGFGGTNTPYFRAYSASVQTIPNATQTKINFDNTNTLTTASSGYDTTNKRFLPTEAGTYFITASIRINGSYSNNNTQIYIYKNTSVWSRFSNEFTSASSPMISISDIVNLNGSSDYVEILFYQNTGGNIDLRVGTENMYFSGYKLIG